MSHFAQVKAAKVTDKKAFIKAMAELGLTEVREGKQKIRAWAREDKPEEVDLFCTFPKGQGLNLGTQGQYGIGLRKVGKHYEMISDWSLTGHNLKQDVKKTLPSWRQFPGTDKAGEAKDACDQLRGKASQLTTKHTIMRKYKLKGFMPQVKQSKDGSVQLTLTR